MSEKSDYSFLTLEMLIGDSLVPSKYAKQDVRLLYSPTNPSHMGFWFASTYGHERITLKDLIEYFGGKPIPDAPENKEAVKQIQALPIAYYIE